MRRVTPPRISRDWAWRIYPLYRGAGTVFCAGDENELQADRQRRVDVVLEQYGPSSRRMPDRTEWRRPAANLHQSDCKLSLFGTRRTISDHRAGYYLAIAQLVKSRQRPGSRQAALEERCPASPAQRIALLHGPETPPEFFDRTMFSNFIDQPAQLANVIRKLEHPASWNSTKSSCEWPPDAPVRAQRAAPPQASLQVTHS